MWIRLRNLQLYAYHGVGEHERKYGGRFEIDVELQAELRAATLSDDLADTIDYVKVQQAVAEVSSSRHYHLLERLAADLASGMIERFPIDRVIIRVRKPGAAVGGVMDTVEVEYELSR
jgi:dihydroneopterin aldolase